jgi:hypothetical protein
MISAAVIAQVLAVIGIASMLAFIIIMALNSNSTANRYLDSYPVAAPPSVNTTVQPVFKSQRLSRWKRFLVGVVWVTALAQPIATLIAHASITAQTVIGFEISAMAAAVAVSQVIAGRR